MIYICLSVMGLSLGLSQGESSTVDPATAQIDAQVKQIHEWYNQIQVDKSLQNRSYQSGEKVKPQTGKLVRRFTEGGQLRAIHSDRGGEHGSSTESYYYWKGQLIFVFVNVTTWHSTGEQDDKGQDKTISIGVQYRYYFRDGKCIRALEKQAQCEDEKKLPDVLQKTENKSVRIGDNVSKYQMSARSLRRINSDKELERYMIQ